MSAERQSMDVDIVCAGFGPATAGFLHTLTKEIMDESGQIKLESRVTPGMPLQVMCYERADDISFGVSGIVTNAKALRESFSDEEIAQIPMATPVKKEEVFYLLDPHGVSRRSATQKLADKAAGLLAKDHAFKLPYTPPFLNKHKGWILSMGQFCQHLGGNIMGTGMAQIWPGMPVQDALYEGDKVVGVRLMDQGVDSSGEATDGFMPGMDVKAALTVAGDGPVGGLGQKLNQKFGLPEGKHQRDWAVGMKMVVELPADTKLEPGLVVHTMGYPEPEIFGFLYVYPNNMASFGIFVPSWFDSPVRTSYRYLQHWMQHPRIWKMIEGSTLRSWGAKSLQEDGLKGEPHLTGDGYARIGEGSGSTNILSNSGVDEAWKTGTLLAEGVLELLQEGRKFTKENLDATYVTRRRKSWLQKEAEEASGARDGFQKGFISGLVGTGLSGLSKGKLGIRSKVKKTTERIPSLEEFFSDRIPKNEISKIKEKCYQKGESLHDALMDRVGWPKIELDGKLLISHQDALLLGGKVQAPTGVADHVVFLDNGICESCHEKLCIEICSGQAITSGENGGTPLFDREKCVHCGACMWSCTKPRKENSEQGVLDFRSGAGGLHSAEN